MNDSYGQQYSIEMARVHSPDLILLDLMMPIVDGWKVCREIRAFSQVPILVVSAVSSKEKTADALAAGANAYLEKPISIEDLVSKIKQFTAEKRSARPQRPEFKKARRLAFLFSGRIQAQHTAAHIV